MKHYYYHYFTIVTIWGDNFQHKNWLILNHHVLRGNQIIVSLLNEDHSIIWDNHRFSNV